MDGVGERGRRDGELVGFSMGILRASVPLVRVAYGEPRRVAQTPVEKYVAIIQIRREDIYQMEIFCQVGALQLELKSAKVWSRGRNT